MDPDVHSRFRRAAKAWFAAIIVMAAVFAMLTIFTMAAVIATATGTRTRKEAAGSEQGDNAY